MKSKTKISIDHVDFSINRETKEITCRLFIKFEINRLNKFKELKKEIETEHKNYYVPNRFIMFVSTQKCKENDAFDEQYGKELAETRALRKAASFFKRYYDILFMRSWNQANEYRKLVIASNSLENRCTQHMTYIINKHDIEYQSESSLNDSILYRNISK